MRQHRDRPTGVVQIRFVRIDPQKAVHRRQHILRLDEYIGADGIRRCAIVLTPEIIRTQSSLKRPFQGWRYLATADAPPDLPKGRANDDPLPVELNQALAEIGVI